MYFLGIDWNPGTGIDLGFFTIHYYSLMFVVAFTCGWFIMKKMFVSENVPIEHLDKIFIYTVVATLIGARLGHVIFYDWAYFQNHLLEIFLPVKFDPFEFTGFRGLASHGAAIGIIIAMYYFSKKVSKKPMLWILDRVVIPVAFGGIFIRIGNFFNSEIVGKKVADDFPLGVRFLANNEDFFRHPGQLYESFGYIIVFFILWYVYWKTDKKNVLGYIFGLFLVLLWSVRFLVEFVKEAQVDTRSEWALNTGQWLSIPLILVGIYLMVRSNKKTIKA